jgi:hypothetical protein
LLRIDSCNDIHGSKNDKGVCSVAFTVIIKNLNITYNKSLKTDVQREGAFCTPVSSIVNISDISNRSSRNSN